MTVYDGDGEFDCGLWLSQLHPQKMDVRRAGERVAKLADSTGRLRLRYAELRAALDTDPEKADGVLDRLRELHVLRMVEKPSQRGMPATWALECPHGQIGSDIRVLPEPEERKLPLWLINNH